MKRFMSKMLTAGAMAGLVATAMVPSSARALAAAPADNAIAIIKCSIAAEEQAVECKKEAGDELLKCLDAANGRPAAIRRCDDDALAALTKCQLSGILGDAKCWVNPTQPTKY